MATGKRVLLIGSGMMVKPILSYLTSQHHSIIIASNIFTDAERLSNEYPNCTPQHLDISTQHVSIT
jgi:glutamyl-tRNA reductase